MTITWNETADLLKLAAVYDQRTVGTEDIQGWMLVGQHQRWTKPAVQRVIVEHYASGSGRPRITPADVTDRLRALRRHGAASFEDPVIPPGMSGGEYVRWYRDQMRAHVDRQIARWAAGEPISPALPTAQPGTPRRVLDAVAAVAATTGIPEDCS